MRRLLASAVAAVALLAALPVGVSAAPGDPAPGSPEWYQRDAENQQYAMGRGRDLMTHQGYQQQMLEQTPQSVAAHWQDQLQHPDRPSLTFASLFPGTYNPDPYRTHWADQGRGTRRTVEWTNRYGARIIGNLFAPRLPFTDPVTRKKVRGPLPTVVVTTGSIQGWQDAYFWSAQGLAEAGYLVLTFDVQGQGHSETMPHPQDAYCDSNGSWRQPQELGIAETGMCAGVPAQQTANFVFGTIDALDWLLSSENPLRSLVDTNAIGLAGHSLGATAVSLVGNSDPRVKAVIGWDNISLSNGVAPRVPTMGQNADYFFNPTPSFSPPNYDSKASTFTAFRDAGVPAMQVALRGSTHLEWTSVPLPASQKGERVAMYYTLAWFDRWLKGTDKKYRADADRRLFLTAFDGSADASSIGTGTWDAASQKNVPYRIAGESVADHLSIYYRSAYALDGRRCDDMRHSC